MTQDWVNQMNSKYKEDMSKRIEHLRNYIKNCEYFTEENRARYLAICDKRPWSSKDTSALEMAHIFGGGDSLYDREDCEEIVNRIHSMISPDIDEIRWFDECNGNRYGKLLDSEDKHFEGDIIITDPCYIVIDRDETTAPKWEDFFSHKSMREYPDYNLDTDYSEQFEQDSSRYHQARGDWEIKHPDDWDICSYGSKMYRLGLRNYMARDTLYGDWSCTTYDSDTQKELGRFCADAGLVSVFLLDEILKYNPDFNYHVERPWTTTLIKDFKGDVHFEVINLSDNEDSESKWDYEVRVIGKGINMKTGEPLNFFTTQTGL